MSDQTEEQRKLIAAARMWAERDMCDPYKLLLFETYLELGGLDAELALRLEMRRNR